MREKKSTISAPKRRIFGYYDTAGMWQPREMNVVCDALSKLNDAPIRAVWVAFSADELESSTIDVGAGCLLVPRGRCAANGCYVGFISTAGAY